MHGSLTDDQRFLRDTVRDIAKGLEPTTAWAALAEAGFAGIAAADSGSTLLDIAVVVEALGEVLCPTPFLGSAVLGTMLLAAAGAEVDGPTAVVLDAGLVDLAADGLAWDCVEGATTLALDGTALLARTPGAEVPDALDLTRPCRVAVGGGDRIGELSPEAHERWLAGALVAVSAELCGVMAAALARAVVYARDRKQFGQPIGSFQAVQHLAADAFVRLEATRSAVYAAADDGGLRLARMAKITANDNARVVTEVALQIHGGIGMTWEFPGHHELRRAWLDTMTLGDTRHHLEAIASTVLA